MRKTLASLCAFLVGASEVAAAQELALQDLPDPTQEATIEVQQEKERDEGRGLQVHGVGFLQYFAPWDAPSSVNLFLGQLETEWNNGSLGFYATARAKVSNFSQATSKGYLYLQQAYGFWRHAFGDVKVGKIYGRFGRLWDYGFYGPLLAVYDMKLQPDLGISAEGVIPLVESLSLEYAAQYFAVDGRSFSVSNHQVFSTAGVRRRNLAIVRAAPTVHFDSQSWAAIGVSAERFESVSAGGNQVLRGAIDLDAKLGMFSGFVEAGRQAGNDIAVTQNLPITSYDYLWAGLQLKYAAIEARYHINTLHYDNGAVDYLHQPGIEVAINDHFGMMTEMVYWVSSNPATSGEKSVYVIGSGRF